MRQSTGTGNLCRIDGNMADKKKPNPGEDDPSKDSAGDPPDKNPAIDATALKALIESKEFGDVLARVVNHAFTSRLEREGLKGLPKTLEELQKQIKDTTIDEEKLIERLMGKLDERQPDPKGQKNKDKEPKEDAAVIELRKQLDATTKTVEKFKVELEAKERQAQEERRKANQIRARTLVKETLAGKVVSEAVDTVADLLFGRNIVKVQDDGTVSMQLEVTDKITGKEMRDFTVEDGIAQYLGTSAEAKLFQPPKQDPAGNKTPPKFTPNPGLPPRPSNGAQPQSPEETQAALMAAYDQMQKNPGAK